MVLFEKGVKFVDEVVKNNVNFLFNSGNVEDLGSSDRACLLNDIVKELVGVGLKDLKKRDDFNPVELSMIDVAVDNAIFDLEDRG